MTVYYHIAELDILYSGDSSSAVWVVTAEEGQHSASIRGRSCRLPFCSLGNRLCLALSLSMTGTAPVVESDPCPKKHDPSRAHFPLGRRQKQVAGMPRAAGPWRGVCVWVWVFVCVCKYFRKGNSCEPTHHSQNANLNHFRLLFHASTNHIIGTSVFPLFGFYTPTDCCAVLEQRE